MEECLRLFFGVKVPGLVNNSRCVISCQWLKATGAMSCKCCWKQGPSIDNQTRKKIWEENYRTRENLKGVQQSEHFWSFQMTRSGCCCSSSPSNLTRKFRSMQTLDKIGCSTHCDTHSKGSTAFPSLCQIHTPVSDSPPRFRRDVGTDMSPPVVDKSVGPDFRTRRVQLPASGDSPATPFKTSSRYKPPDWGRNEPNNAKQYRQQSLQRLRKNEEALQQSVQRSNLKKGIGNWGTEYSRSYKDGSWPRTLGGAPRQSYQQRAGTPMPRHAGGRETPCPRYLAGRDTPLPRHAGG